MNPDENQESVANATEKEKSTDVVDDEIVGAVVESDSKN